MLRARVWRRLASRVLLAVVCTRVVLPAAGAQAPDGGASLDELFAEGATIFGTSCVSCHDAAGGDGQAPALSGHPSMGATDHIVRQILRGNAEKGMPAFADQFSDRQTAAVATYIRNAWDNAFGIVREADVRRVRAESARQ